MDMVKIHAFCRALEKPLAEFAREFEALVKQWERAS